ncbi:MAG TPA: DsbA family protein [Rhizobiales bacterium]|nr:DsbA family protein [Hyphomicrobiales bacterium]
MIARRATKPYQPETVSGNNRKRQMISRLKQFGLMAVLTAGLLVPATVKAAEFNEAQRAEIGTLVREYLLKNPEVLRDAFRELERRTEEAKAKSAKLAIASNAKELYRAKGDLIAGNPDGKITLVEFFDYNCGFCKRSFSDILKLAETDKDLKIVIKEFPILGPGSLEAARISIASQKQAKYWEFHLALMTARGRMNGDKAMKIAKKIGLDIKKLKQDMEAPIVREILARNMKLAEALNIQGTPAFLVDDQLFPGAVGFSRLAGAITRIRKNGGCKLC